MPGATTLVPKPTTEPHSCNTSCRCQPLWKPQHIVVKATSMRLMGDLFRHDCKAPRPSIRHVRQITSRNVGRRPARVVGGGVVGGARGAALRGAPRAATHVESGFSARVRRRRRPTRAIMSSSSHRGPVRARIRRLRSAAPRRRTRERRSALLRRYVIDASSAGFPSVPTGRLSCHLLHAGCGAAW